MTDPQQWRVIHPKATPAGTGSEEMFVGDEVAARALAGYLSVRHGRAEVFNENGFVTAYADGSEVENPSPESDVPTESAPLRIYTRTRVEGDRLIVTGFATGPESDAALMINILEEMLAAHPTATVLERAAGSITLSVPRGGKIPSL